MPKKRSGGDPEESERRAKKEKRTEFNGTAFKNSLKDPTTAMKGLETFVSTAKKLPDSDLYDVVEGYLKISMECSEIFKLLEGEKQTESEMLLVFQSLEMILLRTATDLSHFSAVGCTIVRKTVSSHMKLLQTCLHSADHRLVRQCLSFLSAMVSQGADSARDVFSHIHFNKSLSGLARRKDKMGRPDVRMAFIQFAVSFLVSGDNTTVGHILEIKDFLPEILSSGLKEDRISVVNLILSTLKTRVVQNKAISKTQKVRFFTPVVLTNIASLYKWNGIIDVSTDEVKVTGGDLEDAGRKLVRDLVHSFLLELCCSRKHSISFHDSSLGTAGRAGNIVLLQFLVGLKQATEDELVGELLVQTLRESPDLLARYFKETQLSFTPRAKSVWQDNVSLLKKVFAAQPDVSSAFQTQEFIPVPRLLSMVLVTTLPPVCSKAFFTQGLNLPNTAVQHTTMSMVSLVLRRAQRNLACCVDRAAWGRPDLYSPHLMDELAQRYRETLGKILPDMTIIVSKWQSLSKKDRMDGEEKKDRMDGEEKKDRMDGDEKKGQQEGSTKDAETDLIGEEKAEVVLLKALILQVICLYQKVVPHLVSQSKFDFSKLLKGVVSEKGLREAVPPILQNQVLQLALELPASKFSWFRVQDVVDPVSGEKSVFYLLLKMFVSSINTPLKTSTQMLVVKVLRDSGIFEHTWTELDLWLHHLARLDPQHQEPVIQFLERVLVRLVCNPYTYSDKVTSLVQEAAFLQSNLTGPAGGAASIPISHIDDVLDMVDVVMDTSEGKMEEFGPSLSDDIIIQTFPFSPVVPAALEARNKLAAASKPQDGAVFEYVASVLSDVLHCQRDPLALCLVLLQNDRQVSADAPHPSVAHLHHYYSRWLPQHCQGALFESTDSQSKASADPASLSAVLKEAYTQGAPTFLKDNFRSSLQVALAAMEVADFPVVVKQVLLYVKSTVDNFDTLSREGETEVLGVLLGILKDLVVRLQGSQEAENSEPVASDSLDESDLFLDPSLSSEPETDKQQVLLAVLRSVLQHPCVARWFLDPDPSGLLLRPLNPVMLKQLIGQLSDGVLALLEVCSPTLRRLGCPELLSSHLRAVGGAVLQELRQKASQPPGQPSQAVRALLSLHGFMDSSLLEEVLFSLLLLPAGGLVTPADTTRPAQLTVYGQATLQILRDRPSAPFQGLSLSGAHLHGLATLLLSCSSPELEGVLLQMLARDPGAAALLPTDLLLHCLAEPRPPPLPRPPEAMAPALLPCPPLQAIASALLLNCSAHRLRFQLWCLETASRGQLVEQSHALLPVVITYLQVADRKDPTSPPHVQTAVLSALKGALMPGLCQAVLGEEATGPQVQEAQTLAALIRLAADEQDIRDLTNRLPTALQDIQRPERWQLLDAVSERLSVCPEEGDNWRRSVVSSVLTWLLSSYSLYREQPHPSGLEDSMLDRLHHLLTSAEDVSPSKWNSFVKAGLKYRYRDRAFLEALRGLLEVLYGHAPSELLPLPTLHLMASSHSLFLPTMLDPEQAPSDRPQAKEALVSLFLCLVRKCPSVCDISHLVVLLGAYGATLSYTDQKLLLLLQEYEKNNISLLKFQCVLWGPAAVAHHRARKSLGASLWHQPSCEELLALLSPDRMIYTVTHFPQQRRIIPQEGKELLYKDEGSADPGGLYDPCFLLPLFSVILRPESVVDCVGFVSSHAFGLTAMALSSYDTKVRAAAYHILSAFYCHLEAARCREKRQLLYLMDMVKNGIQKQNLRVPFVITTYITRAAQQMLQPEDHMYLALNRFLLSHQSLDFRRVPEFFKLFYSFDLEHKGERQWILGVLEDGLVDRYCYELCDQQGLFQTLLGFCTSSLCDDQTQTQIVRVLHRAAHVTKGAYNLTKCQGLLAWLLHLVDRRNVDQRLLGQVIALVHVLWFTNLGQKEEQLDTTEKKGQRSAKCLPLPLITEFQSVTSNIVRHLRPGVGAVQLHLLLQTLDSVLRHHGKALDVHREADWLTLQPTALSSTTALMLLQHWAFLDHDATLLAVLKTVTEKHRLKELVGTGREKVKGQGLLVRRRPEEPTDDAERERGERARLTECKPFLFLIFTRWQPAGVPVQQGGEQRGSRGLDRDTAHLLASWALQSLAEGPWQERSTLSFLQWLLRAVRPHPEMVADLLLDAGLKARLIALYHQAFEPRDPAQPSSSMETLHLFTTIMIHLLEVRGRLPDPLHQVLVAECLLQTPCDEERRACGLFLLSLYVREMWAGPEPSLFLQHVAMVAGVTLKSFPESQTTAITDICTHIVSAAQIRN